ncbi:MAG TPA: class I SAM-dependent methyltransferase [Ktedonobacterales bacterium]|jgi:SAM-dependent methyltransferase
MNAYDLIAPYYDLEHASYQDDVDLYLNYAAATGAPILEIGCGSGRLLLPLAQQGYEVVGVDSSQVMLKRAQERLNDAGLTHLVKLVEGDARKLALDQRFRLAFVGLNSFAQFTTRTEQQAVLTALAAHLVPNGVLLLDLPNADLRRFQQAEGHLFHQGTWTDAASHELVSHFLAAAYDPVARIMEVTHFYEVSPQGEALRRTIVKTSLAWLSQGEAELLVEQQGFRLLHTFGDYELNPCEEGSPRLIVVAAKTEK